MSVHNKGSGDCCCDACNLTTKRKKRETYRNPLENWKQWMETRKNEHKKFSQNINRESGNLLMNSADELRRVWEQNRSIEMLKVPRNFDKYRGNPAFWELPPGPIDRCNRLIPTYFYTPTKMQLGLTQEFEQVGIPKAIQTEKDVSFPIRNVYKQLESGKHRLERLDSLPEDLRRFPPDYDRLIITGKRIEPAEEILFEAVQEETSTWNSAISLQPTKDVLSFDVNELKFTKNQRLFGSRKISVILEHELEAKSSTNWIEFKNTGLSTVRFYWKKREIVKMFAELTGKENQDKFYFDKNELIVLPGETKKLPICFASHIPGYYREAWEVYTSPKLWHDEFALLVNFIGFCHASSTNVVKWESIISKLEESAKNYAVKQVMNNLLSNLKINEITEVPVETYTEKQLFESANCDGAGCLPKYSYNKAVVEELQSFYREVRQNEHPESWNYCVKELARIARERDIISYAQFKTVQKSEAKHKLDAPKESVVEKVAGKKSSLPKSSKSTKASHAEIHPLEFLEELPKTSRDRLQIILDKLEQPGSGIKENLDRQKYLAVFFAVKTQFTRMDFDLCHLDQLMHVHYLKRYPENVGAFQTPERLIYETFEDIFPSKPKSSEPLWDLNCFPKSGKFKSIALDDKGKKGRKVVEKKVERGSKVVTTPKNLDIKPDFDPFADDVVEVLKVEAPDVEKRVSKMDSFDLSDLQENYRLKMYLIVYQNLEEMVDAVTATLETCKEEEVTNAALRRLRECKALEENTNCIFKEEELVEFKEASASTSSVEMDADKLYFESILDEQWTQNEETKKYYVAGELAPKSSVEVEKGEDLQEAVEVDELAFLEIFQKKKQMVYEMKFAETSVQTDGDERITLEDLLEN